MGSLSDHIGRNNFRTGPGSANLTLMFELVQQPVRSQIMRYGAWKRQNDAFLQMGSLGHRIRAGNLADITASHATAISLLGVAPPRGLDPRTHIVVKEWRNHRHINNVVCHYSKNADTLGATIDVAGYSCSSPEAVFAQMSQYLELEDLVALGDALMCRDRLLRRTTKYLLAQFLADCERFRGSRKCCKALRLIREDTDSPWETYLRLWLLRYGLPEPTVNYEVQDGSRQRFYLDLAYPEYRVGVEYNGKHHHGQWAEDLDRFNAFQSRGWHIFVAESRMVDNHLWRARFISEIARALYNAGATGINIRPKPLSVSQLCDGRTAVNRRYSNEALNNLSAGLLS